MKQKILLLVLGFAMTTQMIISQVPNYVPIDGLLAYYPFNGNANDVSQNAFNGTVTGATLTTDRFASANSAYNFSINGYTGGVKKDEIFIPFNEAFNSTNITVSYWFNTNSLGNTSGLMFPIARFQYGYSNPNGQVWALTLVNVSNSLQIKNAVNASSSVISQESVVYSGSTVTLNQWHLATMTFDGISLKNYLDGILIGTEQAPSGFSINMAGNSGISIGVSNQANGYWFPYDGKLDDIGIWSRALTPDEITNLYNANICYQNITVTDVLIINTGVLSYNPVTYNNTVTIYPNPAKDHITIDCGTLANVTGYQIKIYNELGQEVFSGAMNTQQYIVPLNTWTGNGLYLVKIYDASNNIVNTKKIILQ